MNIEELFTPAQAAKILNVEPITIRRHIHAGWLMAITTPTGRFRIPRSSLEKYINECTFRHKSPFYKY